MKTYAMCGWVNNMQRCYCHKSYKFIYMFILPLRWLPYANTNLPYAVTLFIYHFTMCYNYSFMLFSHSVIVYRYRNRYRIPNLHLVACIYYPIELRFYLVWCSFHFFLFGYFFHSHAFHLYTPKQNSWIVTKFPNTFT